MYCCIMVIWLCCYWVIYSTAYLSLLISPSINLSACSEDSKSYHRILVVHGRKLWALCWSGVTIYESQASLPNKLYFYFSKKGPKKKKLYQLQHNHLTDSN